MYSHTAIAIIQSSAAFTNKYLTIRQYNISLWNKLKVRIKQKWQEKNPKTWQCTAVPWPMMPLNWQSQKSAVWRLWMIQSSNVSDMQWLQHSLLYALCNIATSSGEVREVRVSKGTINTIMVSFQNNNIDHRPAKATLLVSAEVSWCEAEHHHL